MRGATSEGLRGDTYIELGLVEGRMVRIFKINLQNIFILFGLLLGLGLIACSGGGITGGGSGPGPVAGGNFAAGPAHDSVAPAPADDPTISNCTSTYYSTDLSFVSVDITKADPAQIPEMGKPFLVKVQGKVANKCGFSNGVSLEGRILRISACSVPKYGVYKEIPIQFTANQENHFEVIFDLASNSLNPIDSQIWRFALAPVGYQAASGDTQQGYQIMDECLDSIPGFTDLNL